MSANDLCLTNSTGDFRIGHSQLDITTKYHTANTANAEDGTYLPKTAANRGYHLKPPIAGDAATSTHHDKQGT